MHYFLPTSSGRPQYRGRSQVEPRVGHSSFSCSRRTVWVLRAAQAIAGHFRGVWRTVHAVAGSSLQAVCCTLCEVENGRFSDLKQPISTAAVGTYLPQIHKGNSRTTGGEKSRHTWISWLVQGRLRLFSHLSGAHFARRIVPTRSTHHATHDIHSSL